jgi:hypothetical protein
MGESRDISRRAALSAGIVALIVTPVAKRGLAAVASTSADASGSTIVKPTEAGTPEVVDTPLIVGGMTISIPSTWKQQSTGDRAFSLSDTAGNICNVSTLDAQIDLTSDSSKSQSLAAAFESLLESFDAGDAQNAPHYLSAISRTDAEGVVAGQATSVNWANNDLWVGRVCVAGDGATTYVVNGSVHCSSESGSAFLATLDSVWASKVVVPSAPAADAAGGTSTQSTSNPDAEYVVTIDSCVPTVDYVGAPAVIVGFTFTNNSSESKSFASATSVDVYQDGVQQDMAIVTDVDTSNYLNKVKPGSTAQVTLCYAAPSMSDIEIEVHSFSFLNDDLLASATFPLA